MNDHFPTSNMESPKSFLNQVINFNAWTFVFKGFLNFSVDCCHLGTFFSGMFHSLDHYINFLVRERSFPYFASVKKVVFILAFFQK